MAIGFPSKNTHTLPPGRRSFTDSISAKAQVVRPSRYADGQDQHGTPAAHSGKAKPLHSRGYLEGKAYRSELGERPTTPNNTSKKSRYEDGSPRGSGPNNPAVRSKGMTYHGKPHEPGYADLYKDPIAPSWAPRTRTQRATEHAERVGWVNGKKVEARHPNSGKHGLDGQNDPRASTDGAQGMAHSASGGEHGKPSPRRGAARPSGTRSADAGALDRKSYVPARKTK